MTYILLCGEEIMWEGTTRKQCIDHFKGYGNPQRMRLVKVTSEWSVNRPLGSKKIEVERCGI